MNVALIGGTGNLSTDCTNELLRLGHSVYTITRGNFPSQPNVTAITADRKDIAQMKAAVDGINVDVVIDFLGFTPSDLQIDVEVFRSRISQLIFISSSTVYRKPHSDLPITENHPLGNPFSLYAQNKQACEEFLTTQSSLPTTIVRPSHTYSKTWIPNIASSAGYTFVDRLERHLPVFLAGTGSNPWTLTASSDFAKGLCGLVGNSQAIGETFHITSDEHPTWKQIYHLIASLAGVSNPDIVEIPVDFICDNAPELTGNMRGDKIETAIFDNSKIRSFVPSYTCTKPLKTGIAESIEWMRMHPEDKFIRDSVHKTFDKVITAWRNR